ncbi:hypothetical protein [Variovorax sp. JS1663]|uniref:hypothetical protein n=1 Tax=Variovorax sp. JS1663 TaxID=1851577 RepID=UPI000B34723B|nr:hypothetical protein [Variovorax sp. JS1663]OUM00160.1 hypothetical protein A8M77_22690 [Variovorax sp. JS1663]
MKWWRTRVEAVSKVGCSMLGFEELVELCCSYDGYQREAAIVELVRRAEPRAIAPLLVRSGDWVPEVSIAARQGLATLMRDEFVEHWARALPELAFAYRVRRTDLRDLIEAIEEFLARNIDVLEKHARSPDSMIRRWIFSLRLNRPHAESALLGILHRGVGSGDLPIARLCLDQIGRLQEPPHRREVLEAACRSRLPRIRAAGMRGLLASADFNGQLLAQAMCLDRSAAIRSLAVGALKEGRDEIARRARDVLEQPSSDGQSRISALHILALLKDPQALAFAHALSASPMVGLRRLARALTLSGAQDEAVEAELMAILADESPKVRRLAVEHIRRGAPLPSSEALLRLGLKRRELAIDVMAVLRSGSPWNRLLFALELLNGGMPDADLANAITNELHDWAGAMTNCYVVPQAAQSARLATLWSQKAKLLPDGRPRGLLPYGFPDLTEYHLRAFQVI